MAFRHMLGEVCDIEAASSSIDPDTGELTRSWSAVESGVPCRMRGRDRSRGFYDGLNGPLEWRKATHVLYMEKRDIDPQEHRIAYSGKAHRILGTLDMGGKGRISIIFLERED